MGELGLGEALKSTTRPAEVKSLTGAHVISLGLGFGGTCLIVDVSSDTPEGAKGKAAVALMPVYTPVEAAAVGGGGGGAALGRPPAKKAKK